MSIIGMNSNLISQSISSPQLILSFLIESILQTEILYNTRKIIKPYELDIYIPKSHDIKILIISKMKMKIYTISLEEKN